MDIGRSLREARIRKGLTIKDVEDATKIRSKYLEALEEDDFEVMPGPVFAKAFLRTYASFLKLDADETLEEYHRGQEPRREEAVVLRTETVHQPRSRTSAERRKRRARRSQGGYALLAIVAVVAVALLAWFGSTRGGETSPPLDGSSFSSTPGSSAAGADASTATDGSGGNESTSLSGSPDSSSTTASTAPLVTSGENVELVLTVNELSCWLVVHENSENGAELYAGTLIAGGQQTFDSAQRYWLNVGKPEALAVSINGTNHNLDAQPGKFIITEAGIQPDSPE